MIGVFLFFVFLFFFFRFSLSFFNSFFFFLSPKVTQKVHNGMAEFIDFFFTLLCCNRTFISTTLSYLSTLSS